MRYDHSQYRSTVQYSREEYYKAIQAESHNKDHHKIQYYCLISLEM